MTETAKKIQLLRSEIARAQCGGIRLRGVDWFSWATAGGSSVVILTAEQGVAEVFVTEAGAWILTDQIEFERLCQEETPPEYTVENFEWFDKESREAFVKDRARGLPLLSDRPLAVERPLPEKLIAAKRCLVPEEIDRYKKIGLWAAQAMTEALTLAHPDWTERELAGAGAQAMWKRGLHPTLTLVAGEERLSKYRHPVPSSQKLGSMAMMVYCARAFGLYANLTRFVYFKKMTASQRKKHEDVAQVEATALALSKPGVPLHQIFSGIRQRYEELGYAGEHTRHHQGGTTGYLSREVIARGNSEERLLTPAAVAWNPSLVATKIEDTFLVTNEGLINLTWDSQWPNREVHGRLRPIPWEKIE